MPFDAPPRSRQAARAAVAPSARRLPPISPQITRALTQALTEEQKIGAGVAIGFVLVYSVIDDVVKAMGGGAKGAKKKTK